MLETSLQSNSGRRIAPAGSSLRPWFWQVWAAIAVFFAATLVGHFLFKPALDISPPVISNLGERSKVSFSVTNNAREPVATSLSGVVGFGSLSRQRPAVRLSEYAHTTISVQLAPDETKPLSCEFTTVYRQYPNMAEVEVSSYHHLSQ